MSLFSKLNAKKKELEKIKVESAPAPLNVIPNPGSTVSTSKSEDSSEAKIENKSETPAKSLNQIDDNDHEDIHSANETNPDDKTEATEEEWINSKSKAPPTPLKFIPNTIKVVDLEKLVWAPYFRYSNKYFCARLCINTEAISEPTIEWPIPEECCVVEIFGQVEHSKNTKLLQVFRKDLVPYYACKKKTKDYDPDEYENEELEEWNDTMRLAMKKAIADKATSKTQGEEMYEHVMKVANEFLELALKNAKEKALPAHALPFLPEDDDEEDMDNTDESDTDDKTSTKKSKLDSLRFGEDEDLSLSIGDKICYYDRMLTSRLNATIITGFTSDPNIPLELKNLDVLYEHEAIGVLDPSTDITQVKKVTCDFYPIQRYFECMENKKKASKKSKSTKTSTSKAEKDKKTKNSKSASSSSSSFSSSSASSLIDSVDSEKPSSPVKCNKVRSSITPVAATSHIPTSSNSKKTASTSKRSQVVEEQVEAKFKDEDDIDVDDFFADNKASKKSKKEVKTSSKIATKLPSIVESDEERSEDQAKSIGQAEHEEDFPSFGRRKRYASVSNDAKDMQSPASVSGTKRVKTSQAQPEDADAQEVSPGSTSKIHSKRKKSSK